MQSPVEELLNQADQLIASQKPKAEVYSAMAESLGQAWRDLNAQLETKRVMLQHSVAFHRSVVLGGMIATLHGYACVTLCCVSG